MATTETIRPQPGPQMEAFRSSADILIYGGQAGGGKTWFLVAEPMRRVHNPGFRGVIFRRTYPQIMGGGGIWEEANELYRSAGAKMREGADLDATWSNGANIRFRQLQYENTKYEYQGHQYCYIGFDELTHFTESQFFYLMSRNRSKCGIKPYIRCTCNPDAGSWVARFIAWWIGEDGYPIAERTGVLRYFVRNDDDSLDWADSREELAAKYPHIEREQILSVTFVPATLDDNKILMQKDPGYKAKLMSMPRIERLRLLGGNWRVKDGAIIDTEWLGRRYSILDGNFHINYQGQFYRVPLEKCRRIATIDTAGTSKEKAALAKQGKQPSNSACGIFDHLPSWTLSHEGRQTTLTNLLFLRHVYASKVDWPKLRVDIPELLKVWNVQKAFVENAHHGQPLLHEIKSCPRELVGPVIPGMGDTSAGAKLERAIASGMLSRLEFGQIFLPLDQESWLTDYVTELTAWTGLPDEQADRIDVTSYACYVTKAASGQAWGGPVNHGQGQEPKRPASDFAVPTNTTSANYFGGGFTSNYRG